MDLKITPSGQTIVKPTALGPVANTDTKLLIYGLFQKGRVLAQDGVRFSARLAGFCRIRWHQRHARKAERTSFSVLVSNLDFRVPYLRQRGERVADRAVRGGKEATREAQNRGPGCRGVAAPARSGPGAALPCLRAPEVRGRHHQPSAGTKDAAALHENFPRRAQMLKHVPEDHLVKAFQCEFGAGEVRRDR